MLNIDLTQQLPNNSIIDRFENLAEILSKNTYVKDTTNKLNRIIEDYKANYQILLLGKERVGKSSLINAILGRDLIPIEDTFSSDINIFIKYGKEESMSISFLDGYSASFDLNKLHLITQTNIEISDILHKHIDYITLYVNNELLNKVTLIDTKAIELNSNKSAYFSEIVLNRVDEIFWVMRADSPVSDDELKLLQKVSTRFMKPQVLINGIDQSKNNVVAFMKTERTRFGTYIEDMHPVSAHLARQAQKTNQAQFLIDSNFTSFLQFIHKLSSQKERKQHHTICKLQDWLVRFRKELEIIVQREPYISALEQMKVFKAEKNLEYTKEQRDLAIIKTYEEDYEKCATVCQGVETLYQLLQIVGTHLFLRDELTEDFEEKATHYLQIVRSYRNMHSEYETQLANLKKHAKLKKNSAGEMSVHVSAKANEKHIKDLIILLNDKQTVLNSLFTSLKEIEKILTQQFDKLKQHVPNLIFQKLQSILKQVEQLNFQRVYEHKTIVSASAKLLEFDCLNEAKQFIVNEILPLIEDNVFMDEPLQQQIIRTIDMIHAIELQHMTFNEQINTEEKLIEPIVVTFNQQHSIILLEIEVIDIISNVPALPLRLEV